MVAVRLIVAIVAVVVAGLVVAESSDAKLVKRTIWKRALDPESNPLNGASPANTAVLVFGSGGAPSGISWDTAPADPASWQFPIVMFNVNIDEPRLRAEPGEFGHLGVKVTGRVHDPGKQGRGHAAIPIMLRDDVWQTGVVFPQLKMNCFPEGVEPRCDTFSDSTEHMSAAFQFPSSPKPGDSFSVGIGLLNCGSCYVRWTYTAETIKAPPLMKDQARFLPGRRPTVRIYSHLYDPRHIIVQWGAKLRFCNKSKHINARPQWLPDPNKVGWRRITVPGGKCRVFPFKSALSPGKGLTHSNRRGVCTNVTSQVAALPILRIFVLPKGAKKPTKKHRRGINQCFQTIAGKNVKILR